jgi:hypothetical protein
MSNTQNVKQANAELTQAVERFASLMQVVPDSQLERAWAWRSYDAEGIRFAFFRTYEELRELAVHLRSERSTGEKPCTQAHLILAQYHEAYWDLQAALLGVVDKQLDEAPAEGEWPLRRVLSHMLGADVGFYTVVRYALDRHRHGDGQSAAMPAGARAALSGIEEAAFRSLIAGELDAIRAWHRAFHERILREFANIGDAELELLSTFWEDEPMSLRFRLHRFDSHLRQHTIQMDKTLLALGNGPTEARRLLRLIYAALADVDGALIGAWQLDENTRQVLAQVISARAEDVVIALR